MKVRRSFCVGAMALMLVTAVSSAANNLDEDDMSIKAAVTGFVESWNHHDMQAFANLFAENADFVNVIGLWWRDRAEIQKRHEAIHASRMKNSHLTASETTVRFLRPDVAIVHVRWELTGESSPDGSTAPPRKGLMTQVIAKTDGKWLIAACQNTDIVPLPNVPTGK